MLLLALALTPGCRAALGGANVLVGPGPAGDEIRVLVAPARSI